MDLNNLIFSAPSPTYNQATLDNLIWVPRSRFFSMKRLMNEKMDFREFDRNGQGVKRIPCHYQKYTEDCKDVILYFHGNADDLGTGETFARRLSVGLKANVLSVEYPGYGLYEGEPSAEAILEDAEIIFDFLITETGLSSDNITLLGRSIGCAAAIHLAVQRKPRLLVLISPFTSIKEVVKSMSGSLVSHLVADKLRNINEIQKVDCPVYFIHGKKDELVPVEHSKCLIKRCNSLNKAHFSENMTHNEFSVIADVIQPLRMFYYEIGIAPEPGTLTLPSYVLKPSLSPKNNETKTSFFSKIIESIITQG